MKPTLPVFTLLSIFLLAACVPQTAAVPTSLPTMPSQTSAPSLTPTPEATHTPTPVEPTIGVQPASQNSYTNPEFGFSFQFPTAWFGPQEYVSDQTLRLEVGSDVVYPYGEPPEQPSQVKDSYNVVIQYTQNNQNTAMDDTFQSLQNMQDGEALSGPRSLIIRVRPLELGRFEGYEYIFTLPETAQTEPVYGRQVILRDPQTNNQLTLLGQPINVEVPDGAQWRDVYQSIDEQNLENFHEILDSISID